MSGFCYWVLWVNGYFLRVVCYKENGKRKKPKLQKWVQVRENFAHVETNLPLSYGWEHWDVIFRFLDWSAEWGLSS